MLTVANQIFLNENKAARMNHMIDHAKHAASGLDIKLSQFLELTSFCASSPYLIEEINLENVAKNCGRIASQLSAWIVLVEIGETHRHLLNTRPEVTVSLPVYPRANERPPLLEVEKISRRSARPQISNVFDGLIFKSGIVAAGQYLRLADGRDAMLYVGTPADQVSDHLIEYANVDAEKYILFDAKQKIVASNLDRKEKFSLDYLDWMISALNSGSSGSKISQRLNPTDSNPFDFGYAPLRLAEGWSIVAFQPENTVHDLAKPLYLPVVVILSGISISVLIALGISHKEVSQQRVGRAKKAELEARQQNEEKSRLLASLAHDIRSPLISLIGSLELILADYPDSKNLINKPLDAAETLLQLVDDILELSFLGSGELVFHPSPVDIRQLVKKSVDQVQQRVQEKELTVYIDIAPNVPEVVEVDRLRLQQVMSNLLSNAIKYTDKGTITVKVCAERSAQGFVDLIFTTIDTGIGLNPEDIPRVLKEYGRLERGTKDREPGTGLGLAIVQRILKNMGSKLHLESARNVGSKFYFRLKLPVLVSERKLDVSSCLANCRILYAEDEPVIRELTAQRLMEAGAQVLCATDGVDTLRCLSEITPDLLLVDLQMPGLDGVDVIRKLRGTRLEPSFPIFVLTSHISGPQATEARVAGADAIFTKPIQVAALAAALHARHGNYGNSTPLTLSQHRNLDKPILDQNIINDITSFQDISKALPLIRSFEESMHADFVAIEAALQSQDMVQTAKIAHRAVGLCLVIGAKRLALTLKEIERQADGGQILVASEDIKAELYDLLNLTLQEMRVTCGHVGKLM